MSAVGVTPNLALRKLRDGGLALGFGINHLRTVAAAQIAVATGYDWLMIDMEHGACSLDQATQIFIAALPTGVTPLARIGAEAFGDGTRALDNGAQGVIVPQVSSAYQARTLVQALRYTPLGSRGWGGLAPQFGFAPPAPGEAQAMLDRETLIIVVIETPEAVENAAAIAGVDGIDVLLVGASDLSVQLGIAGQVGAEPIQMAFQRVSDACREEGKIMGMGGVYDETWTRRYMAMGARFVAGGADHGFIMAGASQRARFLRGLTP